MTPSYFDSVLKPMFTDIDSRRMRDVAADTQAASVRWSEAERTRELEVLADVVIPAAVGFEEIEQ